MGSDGRQRFRPRGHRLGPERRPRPRVTKTAYAGLSATVTNPKSQTFQTVTDLRGRTSSSTSFGTDTVTNTHDPYGNLIKMDDGRSHVTQMWYDGRGNKTKMTEPNSGTTVTTPSGSCENATSHQTDRGFTGHEMLDLVGLVHMNGRIYDPILVRARFGSPKFQHMP